MTVLGVEKVVVGKREIKIILSKWFDSDDAPNHVTIEEKVETTRIGQKRFTR